MAFVTSDTVSKLQNAWDKIFQAWNACRDIAKESTEAGREWRAIAELRSLQDYELADIGLCRSDLTPGGLEIAGARRAARQALIDQEISKLSNSDSRIKQSWTLS
ncbi:DUF1127 domain-containing protein [Candidatus Rhodobacter oscarellae]|uniref:DUF1127 domain-containing protein n=1 Tax=Candidatus Rhodobacter oscarellae TaxID=1675527 RepID=UPI001364B69E|nr:DUF1127 domain-containing protein [Candidatus Rhodobacter lobularis]